MSCFQPFHTTVDQFTLTIALPHLCDKCVAFCFSQLLQYQDNLSTKDLLINNRLLLIEQFMWRKFVPQPPERSVIRGWFIDYGKPTSVNLNYVLMFCWMFNCRPPLRYHDQHIFFAGSGSSLFAAISVAALTARRGRHDMLNVEITDGIGKFNRLKYDNMFHRFSTIPLCRLSVNLTNKSYPCIDELVYCLKAFCSSLVEFSIMNNCPVPELGDGEEDDVYSQNKNYVDSIQEKVLEYRWPKLRVLRVPRWVFIPFNFAGLQFAKCFPALDTLYIGDQEASKVYYPELFREICRHKLRIRDSHFLYWCLYKELRIGKDVSRIIVRHFHRMRTFRYKDNSLEMYRYIEQTMEKERGKKLKVT